MPAATDMRIQLLNDEVDRLRSGRSQSDGHVQTLMLKIAEIQLNLATQDRTLGKLESAVNGNGKPGLLIRVDRTERILGGLVRAVWLLTAALCSAGIKLLIDFVR